jgi:hypothetical protein
VPWKIWYGLASNFMCFASEPADVTDVNLPFDGTLISGKRAWCADARYPRPGVELFAMPIGTPTVFMGIASAGTHDVVLHLADGSGVPISVGVNGTLGWFGRGTPASLTWLDAQGHEQRCGPESAPSASTKTTAHETALVQWSCLAPILPTIAASGSVTKFAP